MFGKKIKCDSCGEKINDSYNFCPYCRKSLKTDSEEDWGLLGKNDALDADELRMPAGLNALFNSLMKSLNNQMRELEKQPHTDGKAKSPKKSRGISISISSFGNGRPEIKVSSYGAPKQKTQEVKKKRVTLPSSDFSAFVGLPKKEPETTIRRLSNKVVYEIRLPGVKSEKDISIIQLENSIEIKAVAGKKVFYKVIPINLPINKYDLAQGVLTLELDSKE